MKPLSLIAAAAMLAAASPALAQTTMKTGGAAVDMAHAADVRVGDLLLSGAWTRATPKGAPTGAGFLKITNNGKAADRLVAVTTPVAEQGQIHSMVMDKGVMRMRQLEDGLEIPPGETVELKPGGFHLMFIGLKGQVARGDTVEATLEFEKAGKVTLGLPASPIGASMPMAGHGDGS